MRCLKAISIATLFLAQSLPVWVAYADDPSNAPAPAPAKKDAADDKAPPPKPKSVDPTQTKKRTFSAQVDSEYHPLEPDARIQHLNKMRSAIIKDLDDPDDVDAFNKQANSYQNTADRETFYERICTDRHIDC